MKPYLGMAVIVNDANGEPAFGIVSRVWEDGTRTTDKGETVPASVSVRVFHDSNELEWRPGVGVADDVPVDDKGNPSGDMSVCWRATAPDDPDDVDDDDEAAPALTFTEGTNANG